MTNRLELNWKLDGLVNEQRYYCSETPINPLSPPPPKAILAGDVRTYTDTNIEVGKKYYVRIGSVKNNVEKASDERSIIVQNLLINMPLLNDLTNIGKASISAVNTGNVQYDLEKGALFGGSSKYITINTNVVNFNADYKISLEVTPTSLAAVTQYGFTGVIFSNSTGGWSSPNKFFGLTLIHQGNLWVTPGKIEFGVPDVYGQSSSKVLEIGKTYEITLERKNGVIYLYVDSELVAQRTETNTILATNVLRLGAVDNPNGGTYKGYIKNFKVHDIP